MAQAAPPAELDEGGRWPRLALPWLGSTVVHAALMVVLALSWEVRFNRPADDWLMSVVVGDGPGGAPSHADGDSAGELAGGPNAALPGRDDSVGPPTGAVNFGLTDLIGDATDAVADLPLAAAVPGPRRPSELDGILPSRAGRGSEGARGSPTAGRGSGGEVASAMAFTRGGAGGTGRGAGRPGYTQTSVFGLAGVGQKFVYVFDRSGSMGDRAGAPLAAAKQQLLASLADLGRVQQFQIIFYNQQPRVFNPSGTSGRLNFATDENKRLAEEFVASIRADGGTRHEDALALAMKMAPDVIFFLTDADEPRLTAGQLDRIARLNRGTIVNAIEFGVGPASGEENFLMQLARQNGGRHVYVDVTRLAIAR